MKNPHNIYPFNSENVKALIKHRYANVNFDIAGLGFIMDHADDLELGDLDLIISTVQNNTPFFVEKLGSGNLHLSNMLKYGIDAFLSDYKGSGSRGQITKEFAQFFKQ